MRKQMEGDNRRRRALAREARERGLRPSEAAATLSATKQLTSLDQKKRNGPPPAGGHKPNATRGGPTAPPAGRPETPWPVPDEGPGTTTPATSVGYHTLVDDVVRRSGGTFDEARRAAEATVLALARALDRRNRERLLDALPLELYDEKPLTSVRSRRDLGGFLAEVARISRRTPEQARYQAEATLAALAEQQPDLVDSLEIPGDLRGLLGEPEAAGRTMDVEGHMPPLTPEALRAALNDLPYWSGDAGGISRTVELPPDNLDRVLIRLERLEPETGRAPVITRPSGSSAMITVRTEQVEAVTPQDIDLAHRVDAAIDEAAAGINYG